MELVRPSGHEPRRFAGPGFFRQTPERSLEFTIYSTESTPAGDFFGDLIATTPGVLIPDEELYALRATDLVGTVWQSAPIIPDPSFGPGGTVVRGDLSAVETTVEYPGSPAVHGLTGRIFGDFKLPANLHTKETKAVGGRETWRSFKRRGLKVESVGTTIIAMPDPGELRVGVQSDGSLPVRFETRLLEALQFVLARPLSWDTLETVSEGRQRVTISGRPTPTHPGYAWEPLAVAHAHGKPETEAFCRLLDTYLKHIAPFSEDRWHPLTADVDAVSRGASSTSDTHALVLGVAVESVLKHAFPDVGRASPDLLDEIDALSPWLDSVGLSVELTHRIRGALGAMKKPRAADQLRDLVKRGLIDDQKRLAWEKLRNASAHGDDLLRMPRQELIDLRAHVLVLLHQLVFLAIGYRGSYTDYSSRGWPCTPYSPAEAQSP